jgi:L-aspartate semialdehyde sulfurtransferase ferredoxin
MEAETITKKLLLYFPKCETEKPIVYHLVKDFDLVVNIFRAKVTPEEEGYLILDITGENKDIDKAMEYVKTFNVSVDETTKGLRWDEEVCVQCGNCIAHCPTQALAIANRKTMEVRFDGTKCIGCLNCVENCPYGACSPLF